MVLCVHHNVSTVLKKILFYFLCLSFDTVWLILHVVVINFSQCPSSQCNSDLCSYTSKIKGIIFSIIHPKETFNLMKSLLSLYLYNIFAIQISVQWLYFFKMRHTNNFKVFFPYKQTRERPSWYWNRSDKDFLGNEYAYLPHIISVGNFIEILC